MMNNQNSTIVTIDGTQFEVKYPTVGQLHEMENMKLVLTDGTYGDLARSAHNKALRLLDMVDAFVTLKVLIPKLKLDLLEFYNLDQLVCLEYVKTYKVQIRPFLNKVEKEIDAFMEEMQKEVTNANKKADDEITAG
jgi:hypothetical protein